MNDKPALIAFCREMFGTRSVIRTEIEDLKVEAVEQAFVQDRRGVRVQFTVSNRFLVRPGKAMDKRLSDTMTVRLPEG